MRSPCQQRSNPGTHAGGLISSSDRTHIPWRPTKPDRPFHRKPPTLRNDSNSQSGDRCCRAPRQLRHRKHEGRFCRCWLFVVPACCLAASHPRPFAWRRQRRSPPQEDRAAPCHGHPFGNENRFVFLDGDSKRHDAAVLRQPVPALEARLISSDDGRSPHGHIQPAFSRRILPGSRSAPDAVVPEHLRRVSVQMLKKRSLVVLASEAAGVQQEGVPWLK